MFYGIRKNQRHICYFNTDANTMDSMENVLPNFDLPYGETTIHEGIFRCRIDNYFGNINLWFDTLILSSNRR